MNAEELKNALDLHEKWLNHEIGGIRMILENVNLNGIDLSGANLQRAVLSYVDLSRANLSNANLLNILINDLNLSHADLRGANLKANLRRANLRGANLSGANLRCANLTDADLRGANLSGADLSGAFLVGANLENAVLPSSLDNPPEGEIIGYKKVKGWIVRLQILADSKRSRATTEKCRCDKALVLAIENDDGTDSGFTEITNTNYVPTTYRVGEIVYPDSWDEDRWNECSHGIHFFLEREQAVNY